MKWPHKFRDLLDILGSVGEEEIQTEAVYPLDKRGYRPLHSTRIMEVVASEGIILPYRKLCKRDYSSSMASFSSFRIVWTMVENERHIIWSAGTALNPKRPMVEYKETMR